MESFQPLSQLYVRKITFAKHALPCMLTVTAMKDDDPAANQISQYSAPSAIDSSPSGH
jgi:hypothetical protein